MNTSPFGKATAIILTAVLVFLLPLPYIAKAVNETVVDLVNSYATEFSDSARQQGTITKEMYEKMIRELDSTGELYDIDFEVAHPVSGTELAELKLENEIPKFVAENILFKQEKVSHSNDEIQSFATHTHTEACYTGHVHNTDPYSNDGCYTFPVYNASYYRGINVRYKFELVGDSSALSYGLYIRCPNCNKELGQYMRLMDGGNTWVQIYQTITSYGNTYAWTSGNSNNDNYWTLRNDLDNKIYNPIKNGASQNDIIKFLRYRYNFISNLVCPYCQGNADSVTYTSMNGSYLSCDKVEAPLTLMCDKVVTSITSTNPTQIVNQGDSIISSATATYLDGHTAVVNCSNNFNTNQLGAQSVTLTYSGLVGDVKTTGTRTCNTSVTVNPRHTHTNACYAGHNHTASGCAMGYICHDGRLIANYYSGATSQFVQFKCATCNNTIISVEQRTESSKTTYNISVARYYKPAKVYTTATIFNYQRLNDGTTSGNYEAVTTFNAIYGTIYNTDAMTMYRNFPVLNSPLPSSYADTYELYPPYSCFYQNDPSPKCNQVVTSITPTNPPQSVTQGDSIISTATATYLDGHTAIVNCSSNFNTNQSGIQTVILTYSGLVGDAKTSGTRTCTISVTVKLKHTHTNDCYAGHRHSGELCYETYYFGKPTWCRKGNNIRLKYNIEEYSYGPGNAASNKYIKRIFVKCADCNTPQGIVDYIEWYSDVRYSVSISQSIFVTNDGGTANNKSTWYSDANYSTQKSAFDTLATSISKGGTDAVIKEQLMKLGYMTNSVCYNCYGNYSGTISMYQINQGDNVYICDQTVQDETPICNQVVTSITAAESVQSVSTKDEFITTANATYLDTHTGVVNCTNNLNVAVEGPQTVTLTYSGLVGNAKTSGTRTCTVSTTVKPKFKLTGITTSPISQEVTRYQSPTFTVTANYDNNTSKQVMGFTLSDFNSSILGTQIVILTYKEGTITKTATAEVIVKNLTTTCPICNTVYYLDDNDADQGCPNCNSTIIGISASPSSVVLHQGDSLDITVEAVYANGKRSVITDWTSDYDPSQVGIQDVTITYQTFTVLIIVDVRYALKTCSICSLEYELNTDGTDPGCPVCSRTAVSIEATPDVLTIDKHQSLPITVTATFKDGHSETVNDWASNLLADTAGIYEVMILYQNVIDIINVTVMEDGQIECPYCGLKYLFNDSPKWCPSCYVTMTGIEASLRSGGTKVPYRSKLNLQITKIFKDEHREQTYTGWTVSDYDPARLGNQTITVHYEGFQDELDIEVSDDLPEVTCPNGHTYYLNADGSDPGCPFCNQTEGKAESLFYFDTTYTNFILDEIYAHGEFKLENGDYLKVTIRPRKVSVLSKLLSLFGGLVQKEFTFGGEVS